MHILEYLLIQINDCGIKMCKGHGIATEETEI
jgi:hypothetical protein